MKSILAFFIFDVDMAYFRCFFKVNATGYYCQSKIDYVVALDLKNYILKKFSKK